MKLKLLMVIGAIAPSVAIASTAAAKDHAEMVIARAQPNAADKEKDKHHPPGNAHKPVHPAGQKPLAQQEQKKPPPHPPVQAQKPAMKPAQHPQQQAQKPAEHEMKKPPLEQKTGAAKPAHPETAKPLQPAQMHKPAMEKPAMNRPPANPPHPAEMKKPVMEKPAMNRPPAAPQRAAIAPANRRLDTVRSERHETREGNRTVIREANRTIIREGGHVIIRHNDADRFRLGSHDVHVEHRGNETETIFIRPDGVRIIAYTDADGHLLRRIRQEPDGRQVILIDNRYEGPRRPFGFIVELPPPIIHIPRDHYIVDADRADRALLYATLIAPPVMHIDRRYTLDEIRYSYALRERMPRIDLDTITFDTGSWDVTPDQARLLEPIAAAMKQAIRRNPNEIYLIEGHTDAVGNDVDNLSLSDRRAEAVAEILSQDYRIPPENLTTQGYGEQHLKIPTQGPERRNRRVTVRRITPLLMGRN
jgi:OmpA-OmpF porin, OOP family